MRKLYTTITLAVFCLGLNAQTPNWQWAKSAGGTDHDDGQSVSTDASGNVYVTGWFQSQSITFGTTTLTNELDTNTGVYHTSMFIVKYDASGNVLWTKSAIGINSMSHLGISTNAIGNVYLVGSFTKPSISFGTTTLTKTGIFVVKYDASGNVIWARSAGDFNACSKLCISTM